MNRPRPTNADAALLAVLALLALAAAALLS